MPVPVHDFFLSSFFPFLVCAFVPADAAEVPADPAKPKEVHLRFLLSPVEFLPHADDATRVGAVRAEINHLEGEADAQRAVGTGRHVTIPAGLVLESIGYKSVAVDGVPFDETRNVVRNVGGMVVEEDGAPGASPNSVLFLWGFVCVFCMCVCVCVFVCVCACLLLLAVAESPTPPSHTQYRACFAAAG